MAQYPTSVWSPANKNAGDVIQPAHMNDAQAEIVALEAGLTQGTAPLNSSNSTVVNLSVSGNSTLGRNVTFGTIPYQLPSSGGSTGQVLTCVSTSGSTMGVEWRPPQTAGKYYCDLEQTDTQSIPNSAFTGLNFNTINLDNASFHSTSVNSSRINFAGASTGIYWIAAWMQLAPNSSGLVAVRIVLNDVTVLLPPGITQNFSNGGNGATVQTQGMVRIVSSADYLTVQAFQASGAALQTPGSTGAAARQMNRVSLFSIA